MSAIGGIVDFKNREVDFSSLNNMRLSMSLRGKRQSSAFLCGGVGMFFNGLFDSDKDERCQPSIYERGGKSCALFIDSECIDAYAVSEKYFVHGTDFLGCIDGNFALSLYDDEREILILARDKRGKKPLFYRVFNDKIYFASEVKGILDATKDRVCINQETLGFHITAPMGVYRASNIYSEIYEVLAGECVIFSSLGISKFFFRENREASRIVCRENMVQGKERVISIYSDWNPLKIVDYLNEALIAFDYPQFDFLMPAFMDALEKSSNRQLRYLRFEDGVRRRNILYAREREDRLGSLYGVIATGVISNSDDGLTDESIEKLQKKLKEHFFSMPDYKRMLLREIFGEYKLDCLMRVLEQETKKEDREKKIRILGMLCQTIEWMQVKEILFISDQMYSYQKI